MDKITIDSQIQLGKKLETFPEYVLKNEPMFFNCDWKFAWNNGGEPTKQFINELTSKLSKEEQQNIIIDSRVHMLMPGWFPCIPGFHHDDVPRERTDGQPEYNNPSYRSKHAMVLYNGDTCPTEFAIGKADFKGVPLNETIYKQWHLEVTNKIKANLLKSVLAPSDQIIIFDDRTWHQGTQAVKDGWRLFIRASWNTNRKATNEIRKQVQVYLQNPMEGW